MNRIKNDTNIKLKKSMFFLLCHFLMQINTKVKSKPKSTKLIKNENFPIKPKLNSKIFPLIKLIIWMNAKLVIVYPRVSNFAKFSFNFFLYKQ